MTRQLKLPSFQSVVCSLFKSLFTSPFGTTSEVIPKKVPGNVHNQNPVRIFFLAYNRMQFCLNQLYIGMTIYHCFYFVSHSLSLFFLLGLQLSV